MKKLLYKFITYAASLLLWLPLVVQLILWIPHILYVIAAGTVSELQDFILTYNEKHTKVLLPGNDSSNLSTRTEERGGTVILPSEEDGTESKTRPVRRRKKRFRPKQPQSMDKGGDVK